MATRAIVSSRELKTKSKRHAHVRTAFGELVDNAMGQAKAKNVWIDVEEEGDQVSRISVRDDGRGIAPDNLQKMLGLGFSTARQDEVGQYGEGFKSSTMKLAKDVLVLSQKRYKSDDNKKVYGRTVGFLSQTLHEADKLEYMHTPYLYLKKDADEFEWADVTALLVGSLGDTTCAEQQQAEAAANRRMIARYAFDHLRQKFSPSMPRAMTDDERVAQLDAALSPAFEELFGEEGTGAHIDMFNVTPELLRVIRADESTGVTSPWVDCKGAPASREAGMPGDVRFLCEEPNDGYLYNTSLMEYLGTVYSFASVWPSTQTERSKQFAIHVNGVQVRRHCWDRLLYTGDDQKPTKLEYKPAVGSCDPDSLGEQLRAKEIDRLNLLCGHNARFAEQPGASRNTHEGPRFRPFGLLICVAGRVVDVFNHAHINRKAWQKNAAPERQQASLGSCILVELPKGMKGFITNTNKDGFQSTYAMGDFKKKLGQKLIDFCKDVAHECTQLEQHNARVLDAQTRTKRKRESAGPSTSWDYAQSTLSSTQPSLPTNRDSNRSSQTRGSATTDSDNAERAVRRRLVRRPSQTLVVSSIANGRNQQDTSCPGGANASQYHHSTPDKIHPQPSNEDNTNDTIKATPVLTQQSALPAPKQLQGDVIMTSPSYNAPGEQHDEWQTFRHSVQQLLSSGHCVDTLKQVLEQCAQPLVDSVMRRHPAVMGSDWIQLLTSYGRLSDGPIHQTIQLSLLTMGAVNN